MLSYSQLQGIEIARDLDLYLKLIFADGYASMSSALISIEILTLFRNLQKGWICCSKYCHKYI